MTILSITSLTDKVEGIISGLSDSSTVTNAQIEGLSSAFSSEIYNSGANTTAAIKSQIEEFEQLMEALEAKIDKLYAQQKRKNSEVSVLMDELNDKTHQVTSETADQLQRQKDEVAAATDEAFKAYMKGEITKDQIPATIASKLQNSAGNSSANLEASLTSMDSMGERITTLCNEIADLLDKVNVNKSQLQTTAASKKVLEILLQSVPEHKQRADIKNNVGSYPLYTPSQTALVSDYMAVLKTGATGDGSSTGNAAVVNLARDLGGTLANGTYTAVAIHSKDALNALTGDALTAALDPENKNYSIVEKLYLSGMKNENGGFIQAAYALNKIYGNAGIGFTLSNGQIYAPKGHDGASTAIYNDIINQYNTLYDKKIDGTETEVGTAIGRTDPIGYTVGETKFDFVVDRNEDGIFNDASEFVGATGQGFNELVSFDTNKDNKLSGDELENLMVLSTDQKLTGGGDYAFMNATMAGITNIDLASYSTAGAHQDANRSDVIGTFGLTVNGAAVQGQQTESTEQYLSAFFSHTYGEKFAFKIDQDAIAEALENANEVGSNEAELALLKLIIEDSKSDIEYATTTGTENVEETQAVYEDGLDSSGLAATATSTNSTTSEDPSKVKKLEEV